AYPQQARAAAVGGHVSVNCHFTAAGTLRSCQVLSEDPRGQGFGEAARALTKRFRAVATLKNGKPIEGAVVQIPFTFDPQMLTSPVVGKPHWASTPSGEALKAAFPAQEAGTVRVSLACQVQQGGAVSDCKVVNESPPGHGYGANTLALASQFRLDTWTMEGLPAVGGTVIIPIRYEPVPPALAPTPAKP
ncbi:MAG: TonB family protein, partial [Phenylobacterium sp.]